MEVKTLWTGPWKDGILLIGVALDQKEIVYDFAGHDFHMSNCLQLELVPGVDLDKHAHVFVKHVMALADAQWEKVSLAHWEAYKKDFLEGLTDHVIPVH